MLNKLIGPEKHIQLLSNQIIKAHGKFLEFKEADFYPEHDKRKSSREYREAHNKLVVEENRPCLICGVTNKLLSDDAKKQDKKLNPFFAKQIETHHHVIEWSLANAIDIDKFNSTIRINLMNKHKNNPLYQKEMTQQEMLDWVDHSADNLWTLCDVHHRHTYFGIHHVTYPNWVPQNLYTKIFLDALDEKIIDHE